MSQGLILFAHGARDPRWAAPFEDMARRIAGQRPQLALRLAYLEFMAPDLATAAAELAARGCSQVDLLPVFLGSGGHVRKDLPRLLDELRCATTAAASNCTPPSARSTACCSPWPMSPWRCWLKGRAHEPAPVPLRAGGGAPQPQPHRPHLMMLQRFGQSGTSFPGQIYVWLDRRCRRCLGG